MAQWSTYGAFETNTELEQCCRKGHRSTFLLQTESGGLICLLCLSDLVSDSDAFLVHRTYALDEFLMALKDNLFSSELMIYHHHLLVTPLSEAIGSSNDATFSKSVMDSVLTMCEVANNHGKPLVDDFLLQIARQISILSQWNRTQHHTLHLMGLLLEHYCNENNHVPNGIKNQRGFFPNLISGLQNQGAEFQGEVLYILYKVASLEDGTEELLRYCPRMCEEAVYTLLKTENDELRINCLALLSILAERSVFKIELSSDPEVERCRLPSSNGSRANQALSLSRTFVEAIKGCLLSSDTQVQASALQLISSLYSDKTGLQDELHILVEEGIVDYVVEILRLSEDRENIQSLALDVLTLLSYDGHLFMHRFPLVLQTLVHVLDKSTDSPYYQLQSNTLDLISRGVSERPGMVQTAHAEQLLTILSRLFEKYRVMMDKSVWEGDTVGLPPTFFSACSTLSVLIEAPSCSLTSNASQILQAATTYAAEFATSDAKMDSDLSSLKTSVYLLHAVFQYNQRQIRQNGLDHSVQENLVELCDKYLFPTFAENVERVEDLDLALILFSTFTLILRSVTLDKTARFARRLALQKIFSLSYELLACFASPVLKENVYRFISCLIARLDADNFEENVVNAFLSLPSDPTSLLALLEQNSKGQEQLISAQHAVIRILSTSSSFNDRLVTEIEILASLEQHLLVNKASTLAENIASDQTFMQFLSLYVSNKRALEDRYISCSEEAERIFDVLLSQSHGRSLLSSETPKAILRWFFQKDSLRDVAMMQLLNWFTKAEYMCSKNEQEGTASPSGSLGKRDSEHLNTLAELIVEEACGTTVLLSLFHRLVNQGADDGIGVVVRAFTRLARMAPGVGHQLLYYNFELSLLPLIHPQSVKASKTTRKNILELLFQMLYDFHYGLEVIAERSWLDVANQCVNLILVKTKLAFDEELLPFLSLVNMILFKSSEEDSLVEAAEALACNRNLCTRLEDRILTASSQGEKISKTDFGSTEGKILCGVMIFHLLRIRWALKFHSQGKYPSRSHGTPYIGFQASEWSNSDDCNEGCGTSVTCKHLCQILYYGPAILKVLSSSCVAEIFSQLHIEVDSESSDPVKKIDLPSTFFQSVAMTLQGSVLEDLALVSRNASSSLFLLLQSPALSPQVRRMVANNPWNRILVEHLVVSLSTAEKDGGTCTCGRSPCYAAHIVLGILRVTPSLEWLPIVLSPRILNDMVANLSEDRISPSVICIFHELLLLKYLSNDHLIKLRNLFQAIRKKFYGAGSSLLDFETTETLHNTKISNLTDCITSVESDDDLQNALLELVVQSSLKPSLSLCLELDFTNISSYTSGMTCISMIDKFMQDSYLFVG